MAPELGETQGTAPRAKYSDHGKERGPEDRDRGWASQKKHIPQAGGDTLGWVALKEPRATDLGC